MAEEVATVNTKKRRLLLFHGMKVAHLALWRSCPLAVYRMYLNLGLLVAISDITW